ncbi:EAL and modified HD-GYP domain-containing signal transduction protein [Rhodoferax sp. OV413]|uniref:EAL and HDOD domain-containing protein n=1 Tax=Rhodoferax sp. OV413 TaxID=1855285 RepID=UPI00088416D3|nr:HDOD domain-containing protein [Rhodoferax sp. OV413]SDP37710.1 EAL and modified HD-GYP domain-containing signal transduction protein [Rhodoferax sp. OV413]
MPPSDISDPTASQATGMIVIARQPIVDAQRSVVAYELFDRSTADHNAASDVALIFNAMTHTGNESLVGKVTIFVNCTHESLAGGHLDLIQPDKVVLEVGPVPGHAPDEIEVRKHTLIELRKRGFRLAFNHTVLAPVYASWQPLADYVKLDLMALKPEQLQVIVAAVKTRTKAAVIAEKVETAEQFSALAAYGATLFQGYWFARPDVIKTRVVTPSQAHVLQLINLVRNQASTEEIEAVLKKDAMLGFNLMRLINSSGFGLTREITSFRQAVMLMGLKKLFRWAALLLTASRANGTSAAVGTMAVVRGRMMELLAKGNMTDEETDGAFVVGIFSLLDVMLGMPLEQALELLSLPPAVTEALQHGTGIYGPMLALTKACESNDDEAFTAAANAMQFSNHHINMAHMEALAWADTLSI